MDTRDAKQFFCYTDLCLLIYIVAPKAYFEFQGLFFWGTFMLLFFMINFNAYSSIVFYLWANEISFRLKKKAGKRRRAIATFTLWSRIIKKKILLAKFKMKMICAPWKCLKTRKVPSTANKESVFSVKIVKNYCEKT